MLTDVIGNYHREYQLQRQRMGFHCVFLSGGPILGKDKGQDQTATFCFQ